MGHTHNVHDSDAHFSINPVTRMIRNESSKKTVLVQNDHNSERFTFELPRYVEDHDMSLCNKVEVHYLNIDSVTKEKHTGLYTVTDLHVEDDHVVCSWLVSQNATALVGSLNFLVRFLCITGTVIDYVWNTAIYTGITVSDGINADESFAGDYVDIIEQWKADVTQEITKDVNANVTEWAETESGKLRGLLFEETAKTNTALAAERARIDQMVSNPTVDDAELIDIRVGADGVTYDSAGTAVREQFLCLNHNISDISFNSPNILDFSKAVYGKAIDVAGNISDNEKAILFDRFIHINSGETIKITFNKRFNHGGNYGMVKRPDGTFTELLRFAENKNGYWEVEYTMADNLPDEYRTVSFCILIDTQTFSDARPESSLMCVVNGEMPEEFCPYGRFIEERHFADGLKFKINNLHRFTSWYKGKKVCAYGDSITAQGNWLDYVKDYFGIAEIVNKGIGGTTVHNNMQVLNYEGKEQNAWMCSDERIASLPDSIDVLLVMGGMNDWGSNIEIGSLATHEETPNDKTFVGAYQTMIIKLQKKYPKAKIITMTTTNGRVWNYGENLDVPPVSWGKTIRDIADATMMVSHNYGIPCIDLNGECGFSFVNSGDYLQDAVHPNNTTGAKVIANAVVNGLKRYEPIDM